MKLLAATKHLAPGTRTPRRTPDATAPATGRDESKGPSATRTPAAQSASGRRRAARRRCCRALGARPRGWHPARSRGATGQSAASLVEIPLWPQPGSPQGRGVALDGGPCLFVAIEEEHEVKLAVVLTELFVEAGDEIVGRPTLRIVRHLPRDRTMSTTTSQPSAEPRWSAKVGRSGTTMSNTKRPCRPVTRCSYRC